MSSPRQRAGLGDSGWMGRTLATCFLVLFSHTLLAPRAGHANCAPKLKSPLSSLKNYRDLAESLFERVYNARLEDNVGAALKLLKTKGWAHDVRQYNELVSAFASLNATNGETICRPHSLASLRLLAEAMGGQGAGNVGPRELSEPVQRLNQILIRHIARAYAECPEHFASKWPADWPRSLGDARVFAALANLDNLPRAYSLGFLLPAHKRIQVEPSEHGLLNDLGVSTQITISNGRPESKETRALERELNEFMYTPCHGFVKSRESHLILKPYANLLAAAMVIAPEFKFMDRFYENPAESPLLHPSGHNQEILNTLFRYLACERLAPKPSERDEHF